MPRKSQHLINADWNEWMWDRLGTNKLCKHSAWPPLLFYVEHGQSTCKWSRSLVISMLCPLLGAGRRSVPSASSLQNLKWGKVAQSCLTPCNPMDYATHGILQARILEWVAFPFSRGSSQPRDQTHVSHIAGRFFTSYSDLELLH